MAPVTATQWLKRHCKPFLDKNIPENYQIDLVNPGKSIAKPLTTLVGLVQKYYVDALPLAIQIQVHYIDFISSFIRGSLAKTILSKSPYGRIRQD